MDSLDALVAFSTTDTIGHIRLNKIKREFPRVEDFFNLSPAEMALFMDTLSERSLAELSSMKKRGERAREICAQKGINILSLNHPDYPPLLKSIPDPPYVLYVRGHLDNSIPLAAVIGTRASTRDAEETNRWFCRSFASYGIGVVSGLAKGHDSIAAEAVLSAEGYTIAVMGTAADVIYPAGAAKLYGQILECGAVVSEYPPGTAGAKWRFPRRNRIVSGMARAVFVVQAPEQSGTMITVKMAMEQGRDVYAMPGSPMEEANRGSNRLLQMGAKMAVAPEEIVKELLQDIPDTETRRFLRPAPAKPSPQPQRPAPLPLDLKPEEKSILEACEGWVQADELIRIVNLDASIFNAVVTMLELKNLIEQKPGRLYRRLR